MPAQIFNFVKKKEVCFIMKKSFVAVAVAALVATACTGHGNRLDSNPFVRVENGKFIRGDKSYTYVGANFWYGAILASKGQGGDRVRLAKELDYLKSIGVDNLRILVGSDGRRGVPAKVEPTLQEAPGIYNDTIFDGLDYLLAEMKKRDMLAVLYLNNSWEWSGGYGQYLEWSGHGQAVVPAVDGWPAYMEYVQQYVRSDSAKALFARYVEDVITRVNRYTDVKYVDDPTIMSWQIGNEPRAFSEANKGPFAVWISDVAAQIKSLDPNHMVSTGSEGKHGCEEDMALFEKIHADRNIDYMNIHIWPYNWGWASQDSLMENVGRAKVNTGKYIEEHLAVARKYGKPVVLEEFGYPRDNFSFDKSSSTKARDEYYRYVFDLVADNVAGNSLLAGCNFWAWGGFAEPEHTYWMLGDDYTGDPAQEQQGLNSVFASDSSTVSLIKQSNIRMK